MPVIADSYPILSVFWWMLMFFLFVIWIWLLITVFVDLFRSHISGWAKAGWTIFIVVIPWLGVLVYLIVHGGQMQHRQIEHAAAVQKAQIEYIRDVASSGSTAAELEKLANLHEKGVLTDDEFAAQKAKLLS